MPLSHPMSSQSAPTSRAGSPAPQLEHRKSIAAEILPSPTPDTASVPYVELPAHAVRDSLLHSGSGFDNYRGLYNLAILVLVRRSSHAVQSDSHSGCYELPYCY